MTWNPATIPQVTQAALDAVRDAIIAAGSDPDADPPVEGAPPDFIWIDMKAPPRKPEFVCDNGALTAWVGPTRPTGRPQAGCPTTTDWPIRVRWWICWPTVEADGSVPIVARQATALRIQTVAQAVQRALIAWACGTRYDAVVTIAVGESHAVDPGGGSAGWEWSVTVTT